MLSIKKRFIVDENHKPYAVVIPLEDFKKIETILEDYALSKLMDEIEDDEILSYEEAQRYYNTLKSVED